MRFWQTLAALVVFLSFGGSAAATVEKAVGPEGLLQIEQEGKITVRALRGWERLAEKHMLLAQKMRTQAGLDLLGADLAQLEQWSTQAELAAYRDDLEELVRSLAQGEHLDWSPVAEGESLPAGALLRSGTVRWTQTTPGPAAVPGLSTSSETEGASQVPAPQSEPTPVEAADTTPALPPALPADHGPQDGIELPINDQLAGTYKVKLQVEGLTPVRPEDEIYFQRRLQELLPGSPAVLAGEEKFCAKQAEYSSNFEVSQEEQTPYNLFLGQATLDQPVVIRIDAPDNPDFIVPEKESEIGISYRSVGKSVYVYQYDSAFGDAKIDFKNEQGEISWTPRAAATGRPVGPRVFGIYMAYQIKKYMGDNELGTLRTRHQRIGWVVVAMPGDVYEHAGQLYAIGQTEPLTSSTASKIASAEKFDFTLPEYAVKERAAAMSEDLRHIAWVELEGEEDGRKRVVTNGVAGKWYDDIDTYSLKITPQGENVSFTATLGDKKLPVCNGVDSPAFDDLEFLKISPDGAHVLIGGKVENKHKVYLDGQLVRETMAGLREGVVASDGQAAWIEQERQDYHVAFNKVVTADGFEGPQFTEIHGSPVLSRNQNAPYYIAVGEDEKRYLMRGQEELKPTMGSGYKFTVTPDGAFYAYVGYGDDNTCFMVVNGKIGPDFSTIWDPATFSPDGQRHIYSAKKDKEAYLVVDGTIVSHGLGKVTSVSSPIFSPDSQHWAAGFCLEDESYVILKDGQEIGRSTGYPRKITFSPDGKKLAWLADQEKSWRVYVDGRPGPEYWKIFDEMPLQFSPDSKHLAYFSLDKDDKMYIALFEGPERIHPQLAPLAIFTATGVEYVAIDENRFRRETMPFK